MSNLRHLVGVIRSFGLPVVVALNRFPGDTGEELRLAKQGQRGGGRGGGGGKQSLHGGRRRVHGTGGGADGSDAGGAGGRGSRDRLRV